MRLRSNCYRYSAAVKDNARLRASFNELVRKTFGFDFTVWYERGHWGEHYIPHVIIDGDKVISNVSVNLMQFDICGVIKNYIQLGTVMTAPAYRGQGLNRFLIEHILEEYADRADGIYLFANDSVLDYYPVFGFRSAKEYEYYMPVNPDGSISPYIIEKADLSEKEQRERFHRVIRDCSTAAGQNQNDGMYMRDNQGLYQFWMDAGFEESIYYLPETGSYVSVDLDRQTLRIHQIFGVNQVDIGRLVKSFGEKAAEAVMEYTPVRRERLLVREHKEEDCTLFISGSDPERIERDRMRFPAFSHA